MKKVLLILACLSLTLSLMAQDRTITGTVKDADSSEPIPGVNVIIKEDKSVGVTTDPDGNYSIQVKPEWTTLVFSYIGYDTKEEVIGDQDKIDIGLKEQAVGLDMVVISASKKEEKILNAPASVSLITAERIQTQTSLTPVDNLKKTPGVDIMTTGLVSANVNLRGFNGIFDGSMLTMVDNRIGRVPSLRVNAFQLMPGNNYDIEKIELVRGPGSALYGPNAADGVMHIVTKSPIDIDGRQETNISMTTGIRSVILDPVPDGASFATGDLRFALKPEWRTAFKFNDKVGLKLSAKYMTGQDWESYDPREPSIGQPMLFGTVQDGNVWTQNTDIPQEAFDRNFDILNYNGDARLDFRPNDDVEFVFATGLSSTQNLELTGLGAAQSRGWRYGYGQARFRYKDLFVQYFINASNAGDQTYLIPQGGGDGTVRAQLLIDKSKLHVVQLQHNWETSPSLKFIYGLDALMTRPNTEGSINGRFENEDNINQYGGYVQGEYELSPQLKAVAAARVDYHDVINEVQVSPRAALVFKPDLQHTIRATYNKAFSTPSSLSLSLDLANGIHPLWSGSVNSIYNPQGILMNIRGIGNPVGYNYNYGGSDGNQVLYTNFWDGQQYPVAGSANNNIYFGNIVDVLSDQLKAEAPEGLQDFVPLIVNALFNGVSGEDGTINNADLAALDFIEYLETGDVKGSLWNETGDVSNVQNLSNQKSETTETYELGYKGILKGKLFLNIDGYYTVKKNLRSGLLNKSPFVIFNPDDLAAILGSDEAGQALHDNLIGVENLIQTVAPGSTFADLFENNENYVVEKNGTAHDELTKLLLDANAQLGLGIVTPNSDKVNNDMILTYVNLGNVNIWGIDFGFTYLVNKNAQLNGAYSFVNRNEIEVSTGGTVALNAPKNKVSLGYDQTLEQSGIGYGLNFRWYEGFPANSAVYIGEVASYSTIDAKVFYRPKKLEGFQATVDVLNVLGTEYQTFPGTPRIGRMVFLKLAHTIK